MVDAYHSNSVMKVFEEELAHINGVSSTGLATGSGLDEQPVLPLLGTMIHQLPLL